MDVAHDVAEQPEEDEEEAPGLIPDRQEEAPVAVWTAPKQIEAQVVVARLQDEGIPAVIRGESASTVFGITTGSLGEWEVLVPTPLANRAFEILGSDGGWDEEASPDAPTVEEINDRADSEDNVGQDT